MAEDRAKDPKRVIKFDDLHGSQPLPKYDMFKDGSPSQQNEEAHNSRQSVRMNPAAAHREKNQAYANAKQEDDTPARGKRVPIGKHTIFDTTKAVERNTRA
jgi:hypothetical protein